MDWADDESLNVDLRLESLIWQTGPVLDPAATVGESCGESGLSLGLCAPANAVDAQHSSQPEGRGGSLFSSNVSDRR